MSKKTAVKKSKKAYEMTKFDEKLLARLQKEEVRAAERLEKTYNTMIDRLNKIGELIETGKLRQAVGLIDKFNQGNLLADCDDLDAIQCDLDLVPKGKQWEQLERQRGMDAEPWVGSV